MKIFENNQLDLCQTVSKVVGEEGLSIVLSRMSDQSVIESLQQGKLKGIAPDMKISQTKFFHGYLDNAQELIVQVSLDRIAVFY